MLDKISLTPLRVSVTVLRVEVLPGDWIVHWAIHVTMLRSFLRKCLV